MSQSAPLAVIMATGSNIEPPGSANISCSDAARKAARNDICNTARSLADDLSRSARNDYLVQRAARFAAVRFCVKIEPKVVNSVRAGLKFPYLPSYGC